jgi:hypothetical protein
MEPSRLSRILSRLREALRREKAIPEPTPAMIGVPPSQRPMWHDPADHARDFSERYAGPINIEVEDRMVQLGIDPLKIGWADVVDVHRAFYPEEKECGNISPDGRITVGSGVFNFDMLKAKYGQEASRLFAESRLKDRLDAVVAHEYEEHRNGFDHEAAVELTPETELPISARAREIARAMRRGWKGR